MWAFRHVMLHPTSSLQNTSGTHTQTLTLLPKTQPAFHQGPPNRFGDPQPHAGFPAAPRVSPSSTGPPTGVIGHQLLQAVELGAGGDVEAAIVQLADLVVLHIEPFGVVEVGDGEAVGTCGQNRGDGGRCTTDGCSAWGGEGYGGRTGQPRAMSASPWNWKSANEGHDPLQPPGTNINPAKGGF